MTEPGAIEKVPLKVVPMYIEDDEVVEVESEMPEAPQGEQLPPEAVERPKTIAVGALALAASVLTLGATVGAIMIATNGEYPVSTALAYLAIALSLAGIVAGIVAVVTNRGRRLGAIATVLGLLANPYLLLVALQVLGGTAIG